MLLCCFFFFKQKTAYEMRISDWSSDVCSSDLRAFADAGVADRDAELARQREHHAALGAAVELGDHQPGDAGGGMELAQLRQRVLAGGAVDHHQHFVWRCRVEFAEHALDLDQLGHRSEEQTSEHQSLMSHPYAVF